jgi:hypothetical protein
METALLKETREQVLEKERLPEIIDFTEERREELIATSNYLLKTHAALEKLPFKTGVAEIKNLREVMALPMNDGKLTWSPQWGFHQVFRALDRMNYGEYRPQVQPLLKDLKFLLERVLKWGESPGHLH